MAIFKHCGRLMFFVSCLPLNNIISTYSQTDASRYIRLAYGQTIRQNTQKQTDRDTGIFCWDPGHNDVPTCLKM